MVIKKYIYILFSVLFFASCEKDDPIIEIPPTNIIGVEWVLTYANVYVENLDTDEKTYYDYFSTNVNTSNLDIFGGSSLPIDEISRDVTTWQIGSSKFILNGNKFYGYDFLYPNAYTVVGLENGSARPIEVLELEEDVLTVRFRETYESDGTNNFNYFSILTFIRVGTQCSNCRYDALPDYIYGGIISPSQSNDNLEGTTWVITKYVSAFSTQFPNDTLKFGSNTYTINSNPNPRTYTLYGGFGNNMSTLTLYGCLTFGGDYSGFVPRTFIADGEINNITFNDLFNTNNRVIAFFTKQ